MAKRQPVTTPPNFLSVYRRGNWCQVIEYAASEAGAIKDAEAHINQQREKEAPVGVYKLVAIVKAKDVPVEIERINKEK